MKITFIGPRGAQGSYNFPKLGLSNLVPNEDYDVPPAAGRVLLNTGLAEPAYEEDEAAQAPDALSELAEAFSTVESHEDSEKLTSGETGSVAPESEDEV
jgi:hypothetical protein